MTTAKSDIQHNKIGCNIYACALAIGAIRSLERWGCSHLMHQAFSGFKAIQAPQQRQWYVILGIKETATRIEILHNYRSLSKKYHPDIPGTGDHSKFIEIENAYREGMEQFTNLS